MVAKMLNILNFKSIRHLPQAFSYFYNNNNTTISRYFCNPCIYQSESKGKPLDLKLLDALNKQVAAELSATYAYIALWAHFNKQSIGKSGLEMMQIESVKEESRHVSKLIQLINERGGTIAFQAIEPPKRATFSSALDAIRYALEQEEAVFKTLEETQTVADEVKDFHVSQFLQTYLCDDQMKSMNILNKYIAYLEADPSNSSHAVLLDMMLRKSK